MNRQKAGAVGALAWGKYEAGQVMNGDDFSPEYMRMSQAERERMENDKKND